MAALVQSYPTSSSTITMLQTRPTSASGILQNPQQHHYSNSQMTRSSYGVSGGAAQPTTYRGHTAMAPVAPYAFTSTPALINQPKQQAGPSFLKNDQRTLSAPVTPTIQAIDRSRYPAAASISTTSSSSSSDISATTKSAGTRDDSSISSTPSSGRGISQAARPQSTIITSQLLPPSIQQPTKSSPDRYRRPGNRRGESGTASAPSPTSSIPPSPSGTTMAISSPFVSGSQVPKQALQSPPQFYSQNVAVRSSADDMRLNRTQPPKEDSSRYRRRSIHTVDMSRFNDPPRTSSQQESLEGTTSGAIASRNNQHLQHPLRSYPVGPSRPSSSPGRAASSQSATHNSGQSLILQSSAVVPVSNPAQSKPAAAEQSTFKHNQHQKQTQSQSRLVDIPPRGSSTPDAAKRLPNPSPLSKPMTMSPDSPVTKDSFASSVSAAISTPSKATTPPSTANGPRPDSPAARQLAALTGSEDKKSKTSRLRRAFSFGSAAELRKASDGAAAPAPANSNTLSANERARLRKERYQDEREAEQAKIAERQEAGGIGAGIYSGQGNFFSGSTDNLSISSTASSASVMLRKMGKGMKKSTRSLVGLFRPKSVIGVPAADGPLPDFSQAQVSMVTVEAERERVNVNADPHDHAKGGTGYPKLERNSIDAATSTGLFTESPSTDTPRRSIVGGEKERAEVLAAVKKGILKRSGTDSPSSSPMIRPVDNKTSNFTLPTIPTTSDSPNSSAPSTPNEDSQGHKRTGSVALNGEDYFMSALRFRGESKSTPGTPQGHPILKRNATFSPRIQFHDTWPSGEYDRRGEIATCNRLTPMLAQQIKEELNNFKMEMEVHENSKIYTHFF